MSIQDIKHTIKVLSNKQVLNDYEIEYLKTLRQRLEVKNLLSDLFKK